VLQCVAAFCSVLHGVSFCKHFSIVCMGQRTHREIPTTVFNVTLRNSVVTVEKSCRYRWEIRILYRNFEAFWRRSDDCWILLAERKCVYNLRHHMHLCHPLFHHEFAKVLICIKAFWRHSDDCVILLAERKCINIVFFLHCVALTFSILSKIQRIFQNFSRILHERTEMFVSETFPETLIEPAALLKNLM